MRTHPHLVHPRQQNYIGQPSQQPSYMKPQKSAQDMQSHYDPYSKTHKRPLGGAPYLHSQRSFSSSEEDIRSTPEFEGKLVACLFSGFSFENFFASPLRLEIERNNFGEKNSSVSTQSFLLFVATHQLNVNENIEALKLQFNDKKSAENCEIEFLILVFYYFETATLFT